MKNVRIGKEIHAVTNIVSRCIDELEHLQQAQRMTGTNAWIMSFIASNKNKDVFQKDIEQEFSITRSTASKVVSLMVDKGLIQRERVNYDARLKKLTLTEKGNELNEAIHQEIDAFESRLIAGFSDTDLNNMLDYLARIKENANKQRRQNA